MPVFDKSLLGNVKQTKKRTYIHIHLYINVFIELNKQTNKNSNWDHELKKINKKEETKNPFV